MSPGCGSAPGSDPALIQVPGSAGPQVNKGLIQVIQVNQPIFPIRFSRALHTPIFPPHLLPPPPPPPLFSLTKCY